MARHFVAVVVTFVTVLSATIFRSASGAPPLASTSATPSTGRGAPIDTPGTQEYAYHKEPPSGPLPATLDPASFAGNEGAILTYSIAAKIRELLYQEPCYCLCNKLKGHRSLLDCYTSDHGAVCHMCQLEVIFVYEQSKAHKTTAEIRDAMETGEVWKLDLKQYIEAHYSEYKPIAPN
jgi:Protein of unknown function with PCYCGC motif